MPLTLLRQRASSMLNGFLGLEAAGGLVLIGAAVLALLVANSPLSSLYAQLLSVPFGIRLGALEIDKALLLWINDGLMAIFFLLVSLEIKREVLEGQLSNPSQIALPAICAIGGMVVPALLFMQFNPAGSLGAQGWPIPMATDIAFALGILLLLGNRVPLGLKLLLTAIAVIDDLGAIVLIAVLYSGDLAWSAFGVAGAAWLGTIVLNRFKVVRLAPYILLGIVMWIGVLKSGVHATIAGVLLGFAIPLEDSSNPNRSPLEEMESALHPWIAFLILPVFAFANAGVSLSGLSFGALLEPVPLGIATALIIGKAIGVFGLGAVAVRSGLARLPEGVTYATLFGVALLCGIGFTMSLFVSSLAFEHTGNNQVIPSRLGILSGSAISAVLGYWYLRRTLRSPPPAEPSP